MKNSISFLMLAPETLASRKNLFNFFKQQIHFGFTKPRNYLTPNGEIKSLGNITWITNLHRIDNPPLSLTKHYSLEEYPIADNYNCINVDKVVDIPCDYYGPIAVPITYLKKHCAAQFKILGTTKKDMQGIPLKPDWNKKEYNVFVNGKKKFARIFIQKI